jgi:hypothetical protein
MKPEPNNNTFKWIVLLFITTLLALPATAQEKKKKGGLNIGERIGKLTGDLLTSKTADLKLTVAKPTYYCGVFPMSVGTTESKLMPATTVEGDHIVSISFFKNEGAGVYKILGDVKCNGEPMVYLGLGSYIHTSSTPYKGSPRIDITTEKGDKASFVVEAIPEIKLLKVNGDSSLPLVDVSEDIELEIFNPAGAEKTRIKVSLLTDVMGVRAFNHFADFESGAAGVRKIKIPKASLANPEIAGQLNAGNFNKGENLLLVERMLIVENDKLSAEQQKGNIHSAELKTVACASMPVIVKGKQEGGLNFGLKVTGYVPNTSFGFDFTKPNATTGIPISLGSKFGLTSLTLDGRTFKEDSYSSSSSSTYGGTTYTRTTVTTYTYQFPQLPNEHWDFVMDALYTGMVKLFKEKYKIDFVPVEKVTATSQYQTLFPADEANTKSAIQTSYKSTLRSSPRKLSEIFGGISSNQTSNVPIVNMMKEADVDGLVSMELKLTVGGNKDDKVVLSPQLHISIAGRDENNNNKQGTYVVGLLTGAGVPFNSDAVKNDKRALVEACSIPQLLLALDHALATTKRKEVEFGYDAIWTIGK